MGHAHHQEHPRGYIQEAQALKKLALFDFDGTITDRDTFLEFIKFTKGQPAYWFGMLLLSPVLVLYKAGIIPNWKAKQMVMSYFWKGISKEQFSTWGAEFAGRIDAWCRSGAHEKIKWYHENGWRVVMVSASAEYWVKPWAEANKMECIATRLTIANGTITGKIEGQNCYGPEKVNRLKELLNPEEFEEIHAFGDSKGDRELLALAHSAFYRPFR